MAQLKALSAAVIEMTSLRQSFLKHLCQTSSDPIGLAIDHAHGSYVYTKDGRRYLDFLAGISVANIGHTPSAVVNAISKQAKAYLHVMVYGEYIQTPQVALAEKLASLLPESLSSVYFTNSGTEAVEGALKLAKKCTGRTRLIGFHGSYHGDTQGALSVTGREVYRRPFYPLLPNVTFLPFNDKTALDQIDSSVAAVITEPIQGEGGVIIPDSDFFRALLAQCRKAGALLIFDEAQTGMGRTGSLFAFEQFKMVPDILVLAKALGGGMPLGAFIASPDRMRHLSVDPPLSHVTTFGGHPVSCAAGLASLNIILKKNLVRQSKATGKKLLTALQQLKKNKAIHEARGMGMMIGLEFVEGRSCEQFVKTAREMGLLLGFTLHTNRVVRMTPPLTLSEKEMNEGMGMMKKALAAIVP
jgi:acetylornithine/succinyldiaminopimelate/putrescine aminotransferase